jgi:hypothetical protein
MYFMEIQDFNHWIQKPCIIYVYDTCYTLYLECGKTHWKSFVNKYKIPMRNTSNWHLIHLFILQGTVSWTIILQAKHIMHKIHRAIVLYSDSDSGWGMKHLNECCDEIFLFNGSDLFLTRTYSLVVHRYVDTIHCTIDISFFHCR